MAMRQKLGDLRPGKTLLFRIDPERGHPVNGHLTTGVYEDGRLGEVFLRIGKPGDGHAVFDQWACAFSIALQCGMNFERLCQKFLNQNFPPNGKTDVAGIPRCSSIIDLACRWLLRTHGQVEAEAFAMGPTRAEERARLSSLPVADLFSVHTTTPTHVVGFCFSEDLTRVVLIRKARPAWQAGKLNGVGGRIEPGETSLAAMCREFREETEYAGEIAWRHFCHYDCPSRGTVLEFFCAADEKSYRQIREPDSADEPIRKHEVRTLYLADTIPNLLWLVPMAMNLLGGQSADTFDVGERSVVRAPSEIVGEKVG